MQFLPKNLIGDDFRFEVLSLSLELRSFLSLFISMVQNFFSSE
jgi:hypothetical protein